MINEVRLLDSNLPNADQEGLEVPNIVNEYNEDNFEIDEEAHSDMRMPYLDSEVILEENDVILWQQHKTTSQWRDSEGPKISDISATIDGGQKMLCVQAWADIHFVWEWVKTA